MADASTVAIVSVVTTGVVGLAAPVAAHFRQAAQFRRERQDKDLDELRQLLDSSAQMVAKALEAAGDVSGDIGDGEVDSPAGERHVAALRHCTVAVMESAQRIAIRLGRDHTAAQSYWRFWAKLADLLQATGRQPGEATKEKLDKIRKASKDERNQFLDEAAAIACSRQ